MAVLTVVLMHQRIRRDDVTGMTVVTVVRLDRRIRRRGQLGMRLRRMTDTEVRVFGRMTVNTAAWSTYRMTRGNTRQCAIGGSVYMAVLTVVLMHAGNHCSTVTGDTIACAYARQLSMRLRRMTDSEVRVFCRMTVHTAACRTYRMTRCIAG